MPESEKIYGSVIGFIQFDIDEREYNDGIIRDATIRSIASGDLLRISFWPDFAEVELNRGDLIAVDGRIDVRDVETDEGTKTYVNMNANKVVVLTPFVGSPPAVVKKSGAKATGRKTF